VSLSAVLAAATVRLSDAGVESPRNDAELLAAHVLGVSRAGLLTAALDATSAARLDGLVDARASRVPLQHLTGVAGFRYLDLAVGPGVFVPRPETELLAGWGIERVGPGSVVVDLCTGSGAIALSVAHECPDAAVYAVELTAEAHAWAERNAGNRSAAGDSPITLVRGDATASDVLADLDGTVDVVLTNPPYIPVGAVVAREVAEHDPPEALWGGADGLEVVRRLIARAAELLKPGGWIGIEHADLQGESVPALLRGWVDVEDHADLAGRPRFTTARRPPGATRPTPR
jgi:release factor glutamine methyltransferase